MKTLINFTKDGKKIVLKEQYGQYIVQIGTLKLVCENKTDGLIICHRLRRCKKIQELENEEE